MSERRRGVEISRRALFKLLGGGLVAAGMPELVACSTESAAGPDDGALLASATWVTVIRRDDLVSIVLGTIGLAIKDKNADPPPAGITLTGDLYLARTGGPAYILVDLEPQHLLEESFVEPVPGSPGRTPSGGKIGHLLAHPSRLSFMVPDTVTAIPYELDQIFSQLSTLPLKVAGNAWDENPADTAIYVPAFIKPRLEAADAEPPVSQRLSRALASQRAMVARRRFQAQNREASLREAAGAATRDLVIRTGPMTPEEPEGLVTQLELPARLVLSPNAHATWQHAKTPVGSTLTGRVELWHTRMETPLAWQKTVRALWTRDAGFDPNDAEKELAGDLTFTSALSAQNRADIVHLTTNFNLRDAQNAQRARAVAVDTLMLSSLGGWLDSHAAWNDINTTTPGPSLVLWDHRAATGRDQKVRVAHQGYLYPWGHGAVLVDVFERKFLSPYDDAAYVWQHSYVVVKEPLKTYDGVPDNIVRGSAFTSIRFKTLSTPDIVKQPLAGSASSTWVTRNGVAFPFEVEGTDHAGSAHTFSVACIFVDVTDAKSWSAFGPKVAKEWATPQSDGDRRRSDLKSQRVALAPSKDVDDTTHSAAAMTHEHVDIDLGSLGSLGALTAPFVPQLQSADLAIDAIKGITGQDAQVTFSYVADYVTKGFDVPDTVGGVFMQVEDMLTMGASLLVSGASDKTGGFVAPDLSVSGLSRDVGLVAGDPAQFLAGNFDPSKFFQLITAKLFGVVPLSTIIAKVLPADILKQAPKFATQALDAAQLVFSVFTNAQGIVEGLITQLEDKFNAALTAIESAAGSATMLTRDLVPKVPISDALVQALYNRILTKAASLGVTPAQLRADLDKLVAAAKAVGDAALLLVMDLEKLDPSDLPPDLDAFADKLVTDVGMARDALDALGQVLKDLVLPIDDGVRTQLLDIYDQVVVKLLPDAAALDAFKAAVKVFVQAEEAIKELHVTIDWSPTIAPWGPAGAGNVFVPNDPNGFHLGVDIRGKTVDGYPAGASVFASLSDFDLRLIGDTPYISLTFDRLAFKAGTDGKMDLACDFRGFTFGGPLAFIEQIRKFIPLDGFSDPPALQVSPQGIKASFTLPLPNIAVGVFSLQNLSISAGFEVPFVGKALNVSFAFCSRESPFVLTVAMLGGGGFVGVTIDPNGIRLLEISFEVAASLAVDFGVASGSIACALGIYMAMEADDVKLTGFFHMHGQVQVLGILTASIDLQLDLAYESATNTVKGRASLEIEVSVFCFSASVTITAERKFSGNNNDPTFRDIMAYDPASSFQPWDDYCAAFTLVAA